MLTELYQYHRNAGKYSAMKDHIGLWCKTAKKGNKVLVASIYGTYVLKFCGEFKPKPRKMIFKTEEFKD